MDQEERDRQMVNLSDLETSDSTRMSIDRKALQDQIRAVTPSNRQNNSATVIPNRQAYLAEAAKIRAELMDNPMINTSTGARPKQQREKAPIPPRVPSDITQFTEHVNVTTIRK